MRYLAIPLLSLALACSEHREPPAIAPSAQPTSQHEQPERLVHFIDTPTLEQAIALGALPTDAPQSELARHLNQGPDYDAVLNNVDPASSTVFVAERRRSGHWIANIWNSDRTGRQEISYTNLNTGADISVARIADGEITNVWIKQLNDDTPPLERTTETSTFLGERCAIWRARPLDTPGLQSIGESCITNDGIQLWWQTRNVGHPTIAPYVSRRVEVASLTRSPVDAARSRPPRVIFNWAYWRDRSARIASTLAPGDAPPDHTIWYGRQRNAENGNVVRAQYRDNVRMRLSHQWYEYGSERELRYEAPGVSMFATIRAGTNPVRTITIATQEQALSWRPDPVLMQRDPTPETILGRQCYWQTLRQPPHDAGGRSCWTDDGFILAEDWFGRGPGGGEVAVRLDTTRPAAPLVPPSELFTWIRAIAE
ncbi:MAG: hypothetical protein ABL889_14935 [Terricaulis sp.]